MKGGRERERKSRAVELTDCVSCAMIKKWVRVFIDHLEVAIEMLALLLRELFIKTLLFACVFTGACRTF